MCLGTKGVRSLVSDNNQRIKMEVCPPTKETTSEGNHPMLGTKEVKESITVATVVAKNAISLQSAPIRWCVLNLVMLVLRTKY